MVFIIGVEGGKNWARTERLASAIEIDYTFVEIIKIVHIIYYNIFPNKKSPSGDLLLKLANQFCVIKRVRQLRQRLRELFSLLLRRLWRLFL